jgi:hypothetical protein
MPVEESDLWKDGLRSHLTLFKKRLSVSAQISSRVRGRCLG